MTSSLEYVEAALRDLTDTEFFTFQVKEPHAGCLKGTARPRNEIKHVYDAFIAYWHLNEEERSKALAGRKAQIGKAKENTKPKICPRVKIPDPTVDLREPPIDPPSFAATADIAIDPCSIRALSTSPPPPGPLPNAQSTEPTKAVEKAPAPSFLNNASDPIVISDDDDDDEPQYLGKRKRHARGQQEPEPQRVKMMGEHGKPYQGSWLCGICLYWNGRWHEQCYYLTKDSNGRLKAQCKGTLKNDCLASIDVDDRTYPLSVGEPA